MTTSISEKWNRIYTATTEFPPPARVLSENDYLLPASGLALDLACGLGGNALYLAEKGLQVQAWDISQVAIDKVRKKSQQLGLRNLEARIMNAESLDWRQWQFDVIIVSRFLVRSLCPMIAAAVKPGGLLFYQTFVREKIAEVGPSNPDYLLKENELLHLFPELIVRVYREEGRVGDPSRGLRNEAYLVGQKPLCS